MGSYRDTLLVQHTFSSFPLPPLPSGTSQQASLSSFALYGYEEVMIPPHWRYGEIAHLRVVLDTAVRTKGKERPWDPKEPWLDSYPVLVQNQDRDTLLIGYGDFVPLYLEAKDSQGHWRPIEEPFVYACGNGLPLLFLPPHQVVLTSVSIPHGSFQTRLRLRFGKTYLASFSGSIHPHQFDHQPYID